MYCSLSFVIASPTKHVYCKSSWTWGNGNNLHVCLDGILSNFGAIMYQEVYKNPILIVINSVLTSDLQGEL